MPPVTPTLAAFSDLATWLLPMAVLLIIASLVMGIRKRRARSGRRVTAREQLERSRQRSAIKGDLESLMVEIEEFAKRMGAQLDAKAVRLERLVERAERAAGTLEQGPWTPEAKPAAGSNQGHEAGGAGAGAAADDTAGDGGQARSAKAPGPRDPLTRSVYELADRGKPAPQIAAELDEHVGKVELILALRQG